MIFVIYYVVSLLPYHQQERPRVVTKGPRDALMFFTIVFSFTLQVTLVINTSRR